MSNDCTCLDCGVTCDDEFEHECRAQDVSIFLRAKFESDLYELREDMDTEYRRIYARIDESK